MMGTSEPVAISSSVVPRRTVGPEHTAGISNGDVVGDCGDSCVLWVKE